MASHAARDAFERGTSSGRFGAAPMKPSGRSCTRYQARLFGLVLMMVREPTGAEEVTQDTSVRAYTNLAAYDDRRPFYPWLAAIADRLAQNWLGRHGRTVRREGTSLESAPEPGARGGRESATTLAGGCGAAVGRARGGDALLPR